MVTAARDRHYIRQTRRNNCLTAKITARITWWPHRFWPRGTTHIGTVQAESLSLIPSITRGDGKVAIGIAGIMALIGSPMRCTPHPSYWATDWLIAGYAADHYAASVSAAQAHADAQLAREEADKARQAAEKAKDQAEIAEAKQAQAQAELRAHQAEERAARAERQEAALGKPNPNVAPIDKETKETLRAQIEQTIPKRV